MILQLNLPALERLLAGESSIELNLRQQIVEEFCKKHIKTLVNNTELVKVHKAVAEEIKKHIGEEVWESGKGWSVTVRERVEKLIQHGIEEVVHKYLKASYDKLATELEALAKDRVDRYEVRALANAQARADKILLELKEGIDKRMDLAFEKRVNDEINRRLTLAKEMIP